MLLPPTCRGGAFLRVHATGCARAATRARRCCASMQDQARRAASMQREKPRRRRDGLLRALVLLCALWPCVAGAAQKVYRCADAKGATSYQDRPCADPRHQRVIELAAPTPAAVQSAVGSARPAARAAAAAREPKRRGSPRKGGERRAVMSWECRAANGELFYRHSRCPASIPGHASARRGARSAAAGVQVQATPLPRRDVCRRIHATGASGRAGRIRDETVTTYERNLGRDPCRRF